MGIDIFPKAANGRGMEHRRTILTTALKVAGLAIIPPLVTAATPYVRLDGEHGTSRDEHDRLAREVEAIAAHLTIQPALQTYPALLALWSNLDRYSRATHTNPFDLRARAAILAGADCITLTDKRNGVQWFNLAHSYARLSGDPNLISLAHSRSANAGLYFAAPPNIVLADAKLALKHATTPARQGAAYGMYARAIAQPGGRDAALRAAEKSVELAATPTFPPRIDAWDHGQAHFTASRALAAFPELLAATEGHAEDALSELPDDATLWRAHANLDIAEARTRAGHPDGGAEVTIRTLDMLPVVHVQPVLMQRVHEIGRYSEQRFPGNGPMRQVRERLAALSA